VFYFAEAVPIAEECRRRGLGHVHAHFTSPSADVARMVALLRRGDGRPPVSWSFTAHGTDIFNDAPARLAGKVRDASLVVCVSDFGRSQLMRMVDEDHWDKLRVVHCGLDRRWFAEPAERASSNPLKLLTVGRLEREKGHVVLLEAVSELARRGVPARLELVGDGSRRARLERLAADLGIAASVHFLGTLGQDRLPARYAAADVFCMPSLGEGIPVVLMEAMASGLPAVASGVMGIPELVEDGVSGVLVPPGRPAAFADSLERLAGDPELRAQMGEAGRRRVLAEFDVERSAEQLAHAFGDVLTPTAAGARHG
jgi:glycosyltransferase involved in cell wall biosynthesis